MQFFPNVLYHLADTNTLVLVAGIWMKSFSTRYLALLAIGNLHLSRDEHQAAAKAFKQAAEVKPADPHPFLLLANVSICLGDLVAARDYCIKSLEIRPVFTKARYT